MIIKENTKVYVACPAYIKSGGPELLHQLVYALREKGIDSIIAYYDIDPSNNNYRDKSFDIYTKEYILIDEIEDNENNIIIIPEMRIWFLKKYNKIRTCIWWLSVDNAFKVCGIKNHIKNYGLIVTLKRILKNKIIYSFDIVKKANYNLCQSKYAEEFLKTIGVNNSIYLSDYLNDAYLNEKNYDSIKKEDIVLYNPKKGYEFTCKIIKEAKNIKFVPIQNLSTEEVKELLLKSKVYIDFGNHPGKDRFPREAAMCGCCIITGTRGSAKYYDDVSIDGEYKFKDIDSNIPNIIRKIQLCLNNYEIQTRKFDKYRKKISSEKKKFYEDIDKIFKIDWKK